MTVTIFNPNLHPRSHTSGRFSEVARTDPGCVDLGGPIGCLPEPAGQIDDGQWTVEDPHLNGGSYRADMWPHLLARQNSAAALLPDPEVNRAKLYQLAQQAGGPQPVTLLYRDSEGRIIAEERDVLPGRFDDDDEDRPILAAAPGGDTFNWLYDDLELIAVRPGCDAAQMGEWWLQHSSNLVPDLGPVSTDGIPDAEWTRRDAPVAAAFLLHGDVFADERPAGSVFLAQACDRSGMFGYLLVPGCEPRQQYLAGFTFGGRILDYTPGRITEERIHQLPDDRSLLYRQLAR